jgi:hypothetical protein
MSSQMFFQPDTRNWPTGWTAAQHAQRRGNSAGQVRTAVPNGQAATLTMRSDEPSRSAEPEKAEDWAGDCLFNCYND